MSLVQLPDYGGVSLADVLPAVGAALGTPSREDHRENRLDLPEAAGYVVVLVDGLGADLLAAHLNEAPFLNSVAARVGTCAVPSTTATSLTSLGTALPPGAHGMVGFTSRIPGTNRLLQALKWDPSVDPVQWQPHESYFHVLERAGVRTTVISKAEFEDSGLTRSAQRGVRFRGAASLLDRVDLAVREAARLPSVTYIYDNLPDHVGHQYGVNSARWRQAVDDTDAALEQLRERLPAHIRLLVVADHGMVDPTLRVDIDHEPGLRDGLTLVGGEARFRHLYTRSGAADDVLATWRERFGDDALVLTRDQAIDAGWFGAVAAGVRPRLGDVMVAAGPDLAVLSSVDFGVETQLVGMHGSLSPAEMRIPIIVA